LSNARRPPSLLLTINLVCRFSRSANFASTSNRLFECIGMSQSDQSGVSPVGYIAESSKEPRLNPSGENNEQNTLYRIGCTQEKRELLHQTGRRHSGGGGE